jgi:hypothetical protein
MGVSFEYDGTKREKFEIEALSTKKIDYLTHDYFPFKLKKLLAKLEDDDKKVNVF